MLLTLTAMVQDIKSFKISNRISAAGIIAACIFMAAECFMGGDITEELAGGIGVFGVLYIVYMIGGIGAGDVKLLTVIGLLLGKQVIVIAAAAFAAAALCGIAGIVFDKLPKRSVRIFEGCTKSLHVMHFTVAIFLGEIFAFGRYLMMYCA